MRRVRARSAHQVPSRPPIRLSVGEKVHAAERDEDWPAFVFVTSTSGSGWMPARHLSQPSGPAMVTEAYDTTELPTQAGEVLEAVSEDLVSGWLWCRAASGQQGWVPVNTIEDVG